MLVCILTHATVKVVKIVGWVMLVDAPIPINSKPNIICNMKHNTLLQLWGAAATKQLTVQQLM